MGWVFPYSRSSLRLRAERSIPSPRPDRRSRVWVGVLSASDVRAWDAAARELFLLESDGKFDTRRSRIHDVLNARVWRGDCDDLVATALDLLASRDVPSAHQFEILVSTVGGDVADHIVGAVLSSDHRFMIVGDAYRPAHGSKIMAYRPLRHRRMSEPETWLRGAPWQAE